MGEAGDFSVKVVLVGEGDGGEEMLNSALPELGG